MRWERADQHRIKGCPDEQSPSENVIRRRTAGSVKTSILPLTPGFLVGSIKSGTSSAGWLNIISAMSPSGILLAAILSAFVTPAIPSKFMARFHGPPEVVI